ncbi:MAG TPA: hypothetical protein PLF50_02770 [Candidatus Cloacimonadota bacterium]|nr:hypothetical protein [Candidatus Cloacimonadota bacterium]HOV16406.1 hypothetical protein [Candidatus Cloacimonadota bacterium]HQL14907.1 hypothetical protein [Candidatus Cloacimonadota bacterium]
MKRLAILGLLMLFLAGCVDYNEELWLNRNGSGRVKMTIGVLTNYENKQEINRYLNQPGISLISKSVYRKGKFTYYNLDFKFKSLEAFNNLNDEISNADFFGRITLTREKDGTITLRRKIALGSLTGEEDIIEQLAQTHLQDDLKWRYKLHLPYEIIRTNAAPSKVDLKNRTVSWEYQTSYLWNKSQTMIVKMQQPSSVLPYILVGLAALLLIVSIIWLIISSRKKQAVPNPEPASQTEQKE